LSTRLTVDQSSSSVKWTDCQQHLTVKI